MTGLITDERRRRMNEIDSTIKWLVSGTWRQDIETTKAIAVIMDVLRERQEREKGCDLCTPVNTMKHTGVYGRNFVFCPMCGRRLEEGK